MKLIICCMLLMVAVKASEQTNIYNYYNDYNIMTGVKATNEWPMLAFIWIKNSQIIPQLKCTAVIISDRHILTARYCATEEGKGLPTIESIGVSYGVCEPTKVAIESIHSPTKTILKEVYNLVVLEMDKIKLSDAVEPICIPNIFDFTQKNLTVIGVTVAPYETKTLSVVSTANAECEKTYSNGKPYEGAVCLSRASAYLSEKISSGSPVIWLNQTNKKWNLAAVEWTWTLPNQPTFAETVTPIYSWIKKVVEDGSSSISTC